MPIYGCMSGTLIGIGSRRRSKIRDEGSRSQVGEPPWRSHHVRKRLMRKSRGLGTASVRVTAGDVHAHAGSVADWC